MTSIEDAFFALLRAGLWEKSVRLQPYAPLDFDSMYELAEDQSVVGLLAAGLEHAEDVKILKPQALPFLKRVFSLENRNNSMNHFICGLATKLQNEGIHALLVKGQGIAQCYERPQWRAAGDIDLLLDKENYEKAKVFLSSMADSVDDEMEDRLHSSMIIESWEVELHGSFRSVHWARLDKEIDSVQEEVFLNCRAYTWNYDGVNIMIPSPDDHVFLVFVHILQHFFRRGIGLRQICDWTRMLYMYQSSIDSSLLATRLRNAGIMTEWKVFSALTVEYLGLSPEVLPLYDSSHRWKKKAKRAVSFIMEVGNFGKKRDNSYFSEKPFFTQKMISLGYHTFDSLRYFLIFPLDSIKVWWSMFDYGLRAVFVQHKNSAKTW